MNFTKLGWQDLEKDTIALAAKIKGTKVDEIISISRGGMVVSRILSDLLDLPISHIAIESYADMQQTKEPIVTQVSSREFKGETILLVDEVSDTGKTYERAMSYLATLPIAKVYTASPYIKPHTTCIPDFYVKNLDSWIVFPYDIRETKEAFSKQFGSIEKALRKMEELGFEEWELK
jgi:hypoxanthine phosphoribosyltransferase